MRGKEDSSVSDLSLSLQDNYAMIRLKETLLSQMALDCLFEECADYVGQELEKMSCQEKIMSPPRFLQERYKVRRR